MVDIQQIGDSLEELSKAISDLKKKYGDTVDTKYLQNRFEELIKKINEN